MVRYFLLSLKSCVGHRWGHVHRGDNVGVVMVKDGEDIIDTSLVLEEAVILSDLNDIPRAIALLMGLLFSLNIDYPKELRYTCEVIQKVLMNIGGGQCSSLVHGLRNRLLRKTMWDCAQMTHLMPECYLSVIQVKFLLCCLFCSICIFLFLYITKLAGA